jgi:hypothetical protein
MTFEQQVHTAFFDELQKIAHARKQAGAMDVLRGIGRKAVEVGRTDLGGRKLLVTPRSTMTTIPSGAAKRSVGKVKPPRRRAGATPRMARVL